MLDTLTPLRPETDDPFVVAGVTLLLTILFLVTQLVAQGRWGFTLGKLATGHHRNGYLLAPVTADAIAALVTTGAMPAVARDFSLARFTASQDVRASA